MLLVASSPQGTKGVRQSRTIKMRMQIEHMTPRHQAKARTAPYLTEQPSEVQHALPPDLACMIRGSLRSFIAAKKRAKLTNHLRAKLINICQCIHPTPDVVATQVGRW